MTIKKSRPYVIQPIIIESMMREAERSPGIMTIQSKYDGMGYMTDGNKFVVMTRRGGAIKLPKAQMKKMLREALEVLEVFE